MGSDKNRVLQTESFAWGPEGIKRWPYERRKEGIKCVFAHQVKPVVFFLTGFQQFYFFNKTKAWQLDYFYKRQQIISLIHYFLIIF